VNKQRVTRKTRHAVCSLCARNLKTKLKGFKFVICEVLKAVLMGIRMFPDVTGRKKRNIPEDSNFHVLKHFITRQVMSVRR